MVIFCILCFTPPISQVVSRIVRVCKEDVGLETNLNLLPGFNVWRTFVKSRIYCENKVVDAVFGEQVFTYNRVGAGIVDEDGILYAAFSEGDTSASGSVVCRYNLTDIDRNFDTAKYYLFQSTTKPETRERTPPNCENMEDANNVDISVS